MALLGSAGRRYAPFWSAGKTTLLNQISDGRAKDTIPTVGLNTRKVQKGAAGGRRWERLRSRQHSSTRQRHRHCCADIARRSVLLLVAEDRPSGGRELSKIPGARIQMRLNRHSFQAAVTGGIRSQESQDTMSVHALDAPRCAQRPAISAAAALQPTRSVAAAHCSCSAAAALLLSSAAAAQP
eukprot:gene13695-biopygen8243